MGSLDLTSFGALPTNRDYKTDLSRKLMQPATTNNFMCSFNFPDKLVEYLIDQGCYIGTTEKGDILYRNF